MLRCAVLSTSYLHWHSVISVALAECNCMHYTLKGGGCYDVFPEGTSLCSLESSFRAIYPANMIFKLHQQKIFWGFALSQRNVDSIAQP